MKLRFISWNIHSRKHVHHIENLLNQTGGDLIAFQEITANAYRALVASKHFSWSAFSLDLRPPQAHETQGRRLGCAIFGRMPFRLKRHYLIEDMPLAERAIVAEVEIGNDLLTVCSFHAPPGATWKKIKPQSMVTLAQWLARQQGSLLVGMDANAPQTDHPDINRNTWFWKDEPLLLGPQPLHHLHDVFRTWLTAHPLEAEKISTIRPNGPLAISHKRGARIRIPCRYDFIYATHNFTVAQIDYLYDEAVAAGSDHALVVAELHMGTPSEVYAAEKSPSS